MITRRVLSVIPKRILRKYASSINDQNGGELPNIPKQTKLRKVVSFLWNIKDNFMRYGRQIKLEEGNTVHGMPYNLFSKQKILLILFAFIPTIYHYFFLKKATYGSITKKMDEGTPDTIKKTGKILVICCDATWSSAVEGSNYSNLAKITNFISNHGPDSIEQITYYDSGVGTYGLVDSILGGYTGKGVDQKITMAYLFLINNYEPGDKIFLFGFSRGGYVVRCLIGLIETAGLLRKDQAENNIARALALYRSKELQDKPNGENAKKFRKLHSHHENNTNFENSIKIEFLGVFDSIGAIGIPGRSDNHYEYHDSNLSNCVHSAYHALAAHEDAWDCYSDLWIASENTTTEQVWFPGRHADIGGLSKNTGLSDITLYWMLKKAQLAGLSLVPDCFDQLKPNYKTAISGKTVWDYKDQFLFMRGTMQPHICTTHSYEHKYVALKNQSRFSRFFYNAAYGEETLCHFTNVSLSKELLLKINEEPNLLPAGFHSSVDLKFLLKICEKELSLATDLHFTDRKLSKEKCLEGMVSSTANKNKRIIICCDGTSANATATNNHFTNVARITSIIEPSDKRNGQKVTQISYYDAGVGTHEWADPVTGGLTGTGIEIKIQMAYLFLVNNYNPGDEIFFFGFSRGAYTVRSIVGLINTIGILKKTHAQMGISKFFQIYRETDDDARKIKVNKLKSSEICHDNVPIKFIGVFDTVGSIKSFNPHFHKVCLNDSVQYAYQALAANENRYYFYPEIWTHKKNLKTIIEQRWFPGSHSDVGGQNNGSPLSVNTLLWMLEKVQNQGGLMIDVARFNKLNKNYQASVQYPSSFWRPTGHVWRHICSPHQKEVPHQFLPKDNQYLSALLFYRQTRQCEYTGISLSSELCDKLLAEPNYHLSISSDEEKMLRKHLALVHSRTPLGMEA